MKKISLLIVAMLLLASCWVSAPTDEKTTDVNTDWTEVNVNTDWVDVKVWDEWVSVETTDEGTNVEVKEETPAPTEEPASSSSEDSSVEWSTSVKIGADSVDVNAGWVDVKIN